MEDKTNTKTKKVGGGLGALLLLVIGIALLWSNEGKVVKNQSAISEASKKYITIKNDKVNSKNDGKLVTTKGKLSVSDELIDSTFGIKEEAVKMKRVVETYQWKETCETKDKKKKCKYEKVWSDKLIDSSDFEEEDHDNPEEKLFESEEFISDSVKLGAFTLPEELVKQLSYDKKKTNEELTQEYINSKDDIKVDGKYLTNVRDDKAQIGDTRIYFEYTKAKTVSIMAVQTDDTFEAFTSKKGKDVYKIVEGNKTGNQILESMTKANSRSKWFFRILGTFAIISSIGGMLGVISKLFSKIPVLSSIVNIGTSLVSTMLGIGISLIVIAIAWFRFRPILSLILILIAVALVVVLKLARKDIKEEK